MKRILAIGLIVVAVLAVLVLGTGAAGGGDEYKVRAIFDNAGFLVPGEDVKASGVVIGTIDALDVTEDKKAVVVLKITDPAFRNFKQDATCAVRLQSLLGEKYVACEPTQPRTDGQPVAPALRQIEDGPGEGQYLLPVAQTSSPVDLDMLNNVMQLPERQRLALIINEFGTGVAGNGEELRAVIRRANPALDELDQVVRILADQNRVLAKLAEDSDVSLAPLARESAAIGQFIDKAGETARATAERGDDLERNFELFPQLLAELEPTMAELERFSETSTPVFADLRAAAPAVNQIFEQLGPFSTAALPTFRTLGDAAEISRRALIAARPVIQDVDQLAKATRPLASDLANGLGSLEDQHGITRFMQTVFGFTGAANGFDSVGHYVRTWLPLEPCFAYSTLYDSGCSAKIREPIENIQMQQLPAYGDEAAASAAGEDGLRLPDITLPAEQDSASTDPGSADDAAHATDETAAGTADDPRAGMLGYLLGTEAVR